MSEENVDIVRAGYEAVNRRDFEALFDFYDPEIIWEQDEGFVEPGTHHGHAGVRRVFDSLFEGFKDFHIDVEQLIDIDDDRVLALVRIVGSGNISGLALDTPGGQLWSLRDGRAVKLKLYLDPAEALEAVGLSENARAD